MVVVPQPFVLSQISRAAWPDAYYVLVSLMDELNPAVRAFRILEGAVTEEPIEIA